MSEIHNHLAVAVANVEAFSDGVLEPSQARLTAVLHALHEVEVLLHDVLCESAAVPLTVESRTNDLAKEQWQRTDRAKPKMQTL